MDNQDITNKIKKISVDGVTAGAGKRSNLSASVQHQPVVVRGDSGHNILSAFEHHYVRTYVPEDKAEYMRRYVLARKNQLLRDFRRGSM
jgi:hypothetical protein